MSKNKPFSPYTDYVDSGVNFLGDIPEHWEDRRVKHLFRYLKGKLASSITIEFISQNPGPYPVFSGQTENKGVMGLLNVYEFDFDFPAVLVTTVGAQAMTTKLISGKFSLSQNCAIILPKIKSLDIRYFHYQMEVLFSYEKASISLIMQPSLRFSDLDRFKVIYPPLYEQHIIADFLDHRTAKIDALIEKQERLIALLEEKRSALIARAVTKGLDLDVPMKDSGVEWLGEIPAHWKVIKAKWLFSERKVTGFINEPLLSVTQENGVVTREESELNVWNPGDDVSGYKLIENGQFVISLRSFQGGIELSQIRGVVSPAYEVMRPKNPEYNKYFRYLLKSLPAITALAHLTSGIRQGKNIRYSDFITLDLPLPPKEESEEIANFLEKEISTLNLLVIKVTELKESIEEYRKSLISSAVIGKIDVRDWREGQGVSREA